MPGWMRSSISIAVAGSVLVAAYVAVPFYTAWSIREAIKANDSGYLQDKIEWVSVRSTLKESLAKFAFTPSGEMSEAPARPSLWQRLKAYIGKGAVDQFVDTTVTPTGMGGLLSLRGAYQATIAGRDPAVRPPLLDRVRHVWSRVRRAEFTRLDRFELDMVDRQAPDRLIACVLELRGWQWKMTELRIKTAPVAKPAALAKLAAL